MKTITKTITVYTLDELPEETKRSAIEKLWDINVVFGWCDFIYNEAEELGFKIASFNLYRRQIELNASSWEEVAKNILKTHGKDCETYKAAHEHLTEYKKLMDQYPDEPEDNYELKNQQDDKIEDLWRHFHLKISQHYFDLLQKEYEYLTSKEQIIETIMANEYLFTDKGEIYHD